MKIYWLSKFTPDPYGHGGNKRSYQVLFALRGLGYDIHALDYSEFKASASFFSISRLTWSSILICLKSFRFRRFFSIRAFYIDCLRIEFLNSLPLSAKDLFIWEATDSQFWFVPFFAKKKGCRVFAFPHNLESLVPSQRSYLSGKGSLKWLREELWYLGKADKVYTMSTEERWLLSFYISNTETFPYLPVGQSRAFLEQVRIQREQRGLDSPATTKSPRRILVLGSATNTPTRMGLLDILCYLSKRTYADLEFHIAGFGTDTVKAVVPFNAAFYWHGEISHQELERILVESDLALVYQPPTSGALTRVVEFIFAGVPVICNENAVRLRKIADGIRLFNRFDELDRLFYAPLRVPEPTFDEQAICVL